VGIFPGAKDFWHIGQQFNWVINSVFGGRDNATEYRFPAYGVAAPTAVTFCYYYTHKPIAFQQTIGRNSLSLTIEDAHGLHLAEHHKQIPVSEGFRILRPTYVLNLCGTHIAEQALAD